MQKTIFGLCIALITIGQTFSADSAALPVAELSLASEQEKSEITDADYRDFNKGLWKTVGDYNFEQADQLLAQGWKIDKCFTHTYGQSMLYLYNGCSKKRTTYVLSHGANPNIQNDNIHGHRPLHNTCGWSKECTLLLIRYGADVNARNNEGNTPLHEAAQCNNSEITRFFLSLCSVKKTPPPSIT